MACPFCAFGDTQLVYESEFVVAFRDRFPVSNGHTLVIPRRHVPTYFDANAFEQAELWRAVESVKRDLDRELHPDGYNVGFNVGEAAGQTVMHLHVHVIPRFSGDMDDPAGGVRGVIPNKQKYVESLATPNTAPASSTLAGPFSELPTFVPGEDAHFAETLRLALQTCDRADLLASFVQPSGLALLKGDIEDAVCRGVLVRVLTGDYLGITSADALRLLLQLAHDHPSFEARLFHTSGNVAFHPKSYIFRLGTHGIAYVGSSNISSSALRQGVEWNLRLVSAAEDPAFQEIYARFESLWSSVDAKPLSLEVIAEYERRAPVPAAPQPEQRTDRPKAHEVQREALAALKQTRMDGKRRGLVVLATGLGKTYLSAFDFLAMGGERALFVAHREEILGQAKETWQDVLPERSMGTLGVGQNETAVEVLFASVQTLSRKRHLSRFSPDHFDYIVIDEFHHASASTYRKILGHFRPRFLLGLTATPDRMDGASLLELCDDNLVFRRNLLHGISQRLLVPFHYFGVKDVVDFAPIPWRSGRFDAEALTNALETRARSEQALREYLDRSPATPRRTLAFCCSTAHADHMAEFFREHGIAAVAVHSETSSAPRAESLRKLRAGELEVICAVDVFNEGLDVRDINVVLMLRPTLSPVIFLQQLGRGLRTADGKTHLTVVDFIGNHASFLQKPQGLLYLTGDELPPLVALKRIRDKQLELPPGCSVEIETEAIDMLEKLARVSREDLLLYEYLSFRGSLGRRPTAAELFATGVNFKPVKERYGDWFEFVQIHGDLSEDEARVLSRHASWFQDLLRTKMNKSYKAVALAALIEADQLFEGMDVTQNARRAYEYIQRHLLLFRELREDSGRHPFSTTAVRHWRDMPLKVWVSGDSTSRPWFRLDGDRFAPTFEVLEEDRSTFEEMTDELVEFRVRMRLDALQRSAPVGADEAPVVLMVSHASGRPILRFDRTLRPDTPEADTPVEVDGESYFFRFVKIAVNVATETAGGPNVLPMLMRRWFGPSAGQPGTHHRVELHRIGERWVLTRPAASESVTAGAEVIPFPRLPFYSELKVACGAFDKADRLAEASELLPIRADTMTDATRHFVVRASGDSMDGGDRPIRDGDLVLCEWWQGSPAEVEGRPFLLVGHDAADSTFAAMKVPVRRDNKWVLRSWNPTQADQELPVGGEVEPVARVLSVVEQATGLTLWGKYNRDNIAKAFGSTNNPSWEVGHRDIDVNEQPHSVLMVKLRKDASTKPEHRYADRFLSRSEFQWESQASTALDSAKGRRITGHSEEDRSVHLFARYDSKDDFVYCGRLRYQRHEGEKPMRVWWELETPLPEGLWKVWRV